MSLWKIMVKGFSEPCIWGFFYAGLGYVNECRVYYVAEDQNAFTKWCQFWAASSEAKQHQVLKYAAEYWHEWYLYQKLIN